MKHPEDLLHKQISQYLTILQNQKRIDDFTYNASGELRTKTTGSLLKAKGLRKGLPDYTVRIKKNCCFKPLVMSLISFTLHLEAKAPNGRQTKEQWDFQCSAKECINEHYAIVRSIDDVQKAVEYADNLASRLASEICKMKDYIEGLKEKLRDQTKLTK